MSLLIITSTVNVNSSLTVLVDPEIRLQQYISSILFYIKVKNLKSIIVCDNSGYDYSKTNALKTLAEKYSKKIEFLSFTSDHVNTMKYGKGYGEGEIMEFVVKNSQLYKNGENSFFKVTGRIIIPNIEKVIRFTPPRKNCFQRTVFNSLKTEDKIDTRFYYIKKVEFEKYLIRSYKNVNDNEGFYLEHAYFKSIIKDKIKYSLFYILPFIKGVSGSTGVDYEIPKRSFVIRWLVNIMLNVARVK
jgi:hypothetical protein